MNISGRSWRASLQYLAAITTAALAIAACGATSAANSAGSTATDQPSGKPVAGGTAYYAEQPLSPPNYIFPLVSGEYYSTANTAEFQTLLYRPLYWYGNDNKPGVDYNLSLAQAPVYSDHDTVVTITLKPGKWSDGEPIDARDVAFWINLLKANKDDWASYVPGGFPDNVVGYSFGKSIVRHRAGGGSSLTIPAKTLQDTIQLKLNRSYNPVWFTNNELSQITPLPLAWDRTSLSQPAPTKSDAFYCDPYMAVSVNTASDLKNCLPDYTTAGARKVYNFLNAQSKDVSTYASSPIWSVVDGPWKLTQLTQTGAATFVPNPKYDGPNKPRLSKFVELPFTSAEAEFSVLEAGDASGDSGSGTQVSVGYVPDNDVPQATRLQQQGYRLSDSYQYGFDYLEPNFNNPTVGAIFKQLYFRQAFQHLINEPGWIHAFYGGLALPNYSPVPALPANPYSDAQASQNPYPYSTTTAQRLLSAHGWSVKPNGITTCVKPGTGASECGAGIPSGKQLVFTLMYPSDRSYAAGAMTDLQSAASEVGIKLELKGVTSATVDAVVEPCRAKQAACSWELGNYGGAWVFEPDHYPTGEEIFQTGALGNVNNYSNSAVDKLIKATTTVPAARAQAALNAYANTVREHLPDFWQPSPGVLVSVQGNLGGVIANAYGFISPEEWYFTRK